MAWGECMANGKTSVENVVNQWLGWTVLVTAAFSAAMITALHVLQPGLDPLSHAISEYVHGPFGGLMTVTFFSQSLGSLALAVIVTKAGLNQRRATVGGILLVVAALGGAVAGIFPTEPTNTVPQTTPGLIHAIAGVTRFLSLAVALPLLSSALKRHPAWQSSGTALAGLAGLFVVAFLVTIFVLTHLDLFGLGQRVFIGVLLVWMCVAAYPEVRSR